MDEKMWGDDDEPPPEEEGQKKESKYEKDAPVQVGGAVYRGLCWVRVWVCDPGGSAGALVRACGIRSLCPACCLA